MAHTLLLADDSVTIQRVIELTFADEDIRVVAVSDGDQAIAFLDRTPPDIVLADVGMPGRDGYEVAAHVKRSPALAHIPVVLLTGAFEPVDKVRAAKAGCDGVLAKPFEPQLVISRVKELLARPREVPPLDATISVPQPESPWTTSSADEATPPSVEAPVRAAAADVDDYFDRLDRAFANMSNAPKEEPPAPAAPARTSPEEVNWFSTAAPPVAVPAMPVPERADEMPDDGMPEVPLPAAPEPIAQPASVDAPAMPPLADAFAALLAAEQAVGLPPHGPWPLAHPEPSQTTPAPLSDAAIDDCVRRVLDRMSDHVVRESVATIVSEVAERLVKEEIARIRGTQS